MQDVPQCDRGLSTREALRRLRSELAECLDTYEAQLKSTRWSEMLRSSFLHHNNVMSVMPWSSVAVVLVCSVLLFVAYAAQPQGWVRNRIFMKLTKKSCYNDCDNTRILNFTNDRTFTCILVFIFAI